MRGSIRRATNVKMKRPTVATVTAKGFFRCAENGTTYETCTTISADDNMTMQCSHIYDPVMFVGDLLLP